MKTNYKDPTNFIELELNKNDVVKARENYFFNATEIMSALQNMLKVSQNMGYVTGTNAASDTISKYIEDEALPELKTLISKNNALKGELAAGETTRNLDIDVKSAYPIDELNKQIFNIFKATCEISHLMEKFPIN